MKNHHILLLIPFILIWTTACRKIDTPNEESKKVFGSWSFINDSGGFSGAGGSNRFQNNDWIEIKKKGCLVVHRNDEVERKKKFKIKMKESIHDAEKRSSLVFKKNQYNTYQVYGDTLILSDEMYDGYSYVFMKK